MKILVFEWMVGGGAWWDGQTPQAEANLLQQGSAMFNALAEDIGAAGHQVFASVDTRCGEIIKHPIEHQLPVASREQLPKALFELAGLVDRVFVIAPESGRRLERVHRWLKTCQQKLVGPDPVFTQRFSSKTNFLRQLANNGVSVPQGRLLKCWNENGRIDPGPMPAVIKPDRGAGGEGVRLVKDWGHFDWAKLGKVAGATHWRMEEFIDGTPMSIAMIHSQDRLTLLPPLGQVLSREQVGPYLRSFHPVDDRAAEAAIDLGRQVAAALPTWNGYLGLDLVFQRTGQAVAIELNCRLTMSYVWLREICDENLAELLINKRSTG